MPDVSGPGGSTPSAHQNLPATAGLDGFEYRTVAEAGLAQIVKNDDALKTMQTSIAQLKNNLDQLQRSATGSDELRN